MRDVGYLPDVRLIEPTVGDCLRLRCSQIAQTRWVIDHRNSRCVTVRAGSDAESPMVVVAPTREIRRPASSSRRGLLTSTRAVVKSGDLRHGQIHFVDQPTKVFQNCVFDRIERHIVVSRDSLTNLTQRALPVDQLDQFSRHAMKGRPGTHTLYAYAIGPASMMGVSQHWNVCDTTCLSTA